MNNDDVDKLVDVYVKRIMTVAVVIITVLGIISVIYYKKYVLLSMFIVLMTYTHILVIIIYISKIFFKWSYTPVSKYEIRGKFTKALAVNTLLTMLNLILMIPYIVVIDIIIEIINKK